MKGKCRFLENGKCTIEIEGFPAPECPYKDFSDCLDYEESED